MIAVSIGIVTGSARDQNSAATPQVSNPCSQEMLQQIKKGQSINSDLSTEKSDSSSVQALLKISGGDLGKFSNPGSRAKNDAYQAAKGKSKNMFAQAFQPQPIPIGSGTRVARGSESALIREFSPNGGNNSNVGRASARRPGPKPYDAAGASCGRPVKIISVNQTTDLSAEKDNNNSPQGGKQAIIKEKVVGDEDKSITMPTQTQMAGFLTDDNKTVSIPKILDEIDRLKSKIGCIDYTCSSERFESLATENGNLTTSSAREALSAVQGEMLGLFQNTTRQNYGKVLGTDFRIEGLGPFSQCTHLEIKNPVGSEILRQNGLKTSMAQQGRSIGKKLTWQMENWSNPNTTNAMKGLDPTVILPESSRNVLGLINERDIYSSKERETFTKQFLKNSNSDHDIVIINTGNETQNLEHHNQTIISSADDR